ncbi:3-phosphoserine/phosphohydroxythreonine transaminase [Saprospiraceae bacterium]|nr:3-phosphoserine/phosphohydroxythreonine transaminase [Saprospiraceae bacterium]
MKKYNFFAGPAILPQEVLMKAAEAVNDFEGMGLSLLEISHRSKQFSAVLEEAIALPKELLNVPDNYEAMFLTGGASSQFFMSAMNLLDDSEKAGYINTGTWSTKAIKEAKLYGDISEVASSKDTNFNYIPKGVTPDSDLKYIHYTSNNTIFGTQFHALPTENVPLIADMSSDIFSRKIDVSKHMMIYAGAQKNMGPAGTTLVLINKDALGKVSRQIPTMLDYNTHISKGSSFNTPPVFPIYVSYLTMKWVKANGGVAGMEKRNAEKADLLYGEIDRNGLFEGTAAIEDRSLMNVCFLLKDDSLKAAFLEKAEAAGCMGLAGHRSVGGFRASIYNAMNKEGVEVLVDVMKDFEKTNG